MDVAVHCFKHGIISGQSLHAHVVQTLRISEGANLAPRSTATGCVTLVSQYRPSLPTGPKAAPAVEIAHHADRIGTHNLTPTHVPKR